MKNVLEVIAIAKAQAPFAQMASSAKLCVEDAEACLARGDEERARSRALKSLAYSVGIMSNVYKEAAQ